MKKSTAARWLALSGMRGVLATALQPDGIIVLNYHRVGDGSVSPYDRELWSATAEAFDEEVAFLARHCDVIGPADIEYARNAPRGRYAMITFDDGYRDNYELAFPVLRARGVPAAFFIATGFIDAPSLPWWDEIACLVRTTPAERLPMAGWLPQPLSLAAGDRCDAIRALLRTFKSLPSERTAAFLAQLRDEAAVEAPLPQDHWMTWDMIREMNAAGMTIGGHTVHHPVLARMSRERQRGEIAGCASRIYVETGRRMEYFAYPVGNRDCFNADTEDCLRELDVRFAFSYYGGFATRHSPRYDMPRVAIETALDPAEFKAMVRLPQIFCRRAYV